VFDELSVGRPEAARSRQFFADRSGKRQIFNSFSVPLLITRTSLCATKPVENKHFTEHQRGAFSPSTERF
jgi:hypothetical protein